MLQLQHIAANRHDRYRTIQHMNITADERARFRTLQHMAITADGRYRLKTSLLRILKILVSRRLSQLDVNAEILRFFSTIPLSRAVAIVAVALISNNIRLQ